MNNYRIHFIGETSSKGSVLIAATSAEDAMKTFFDAHRQDIYGEVIEITCAVQP